MSHAKRPVKAGLLYLSSMLYRVDGPPEILHTTIACRKTAFTTEEYPWCTSQGLKQTPELELEKGAKVIEYAKKRKQ